MSAMTGYEMFWPIIAHVALVCVLYMLLSYRRRKYGPGRKGPDLELPRKPR